MKIMKRFARVFTLSVLWAGFTLAGGASLASAKSDINLGTVYHTWNSNFQAEGYETLVPLSFAFLSNSGKFQVTASTAFVQGHYETKDLGYGGSQFNGNRLTDSLLGIGFSHPIGSFDSALVVQANLPTGDKRWETIESPSSVPVVFESSRYRGQGFGVNAIYGLGKDFGAGWNGMVSGGYLYSSSVDSGMEWGKVQLGSYAVLGLSAARKTETSMFRLKATEYLTQNTKAESTAIYRAPSDTVLELHGEIGKSTRFLLDTAYSLYGKAELLQPAVGLTKESENSFGDRFYVHPSLEYGVSSKLKMSTGFTFKTITANDYPVTDSLYNGGGYLWGGDQAVKWLMSSNVFTKFSVGYNRITNKDAALDSVGRLTNVTYNDVSCGTGVGYQW
jgi:hypothetical protein